MSIRLSKHIVTILLLISAILVTSSPYLNTPQPVRAVPGSVTLNPTFAGRGAIVSVSGNGFIFANGTTLGKGGGLVSCTFFSLDRSGSNRNLITSPICSITSIDNSTFSGSFVVNGTLSPIRNPYTFIVNMTDSGPSRRFIKAQTTFSVTFISIQPPKGSFGTTVNVNGTVASGDTTCSVSGTPISTQSCVIASSVGGNFSGSFVVANVAPGPYTVTVTGSPSGATVYTTFTVTTPFIYLMPVKGGVGTYVTVVGSGYSFSDVTCSLSSPTLSSFIVTSACSMHTYPNGTRQPIASFNVGSVASGAYIVRLTGSVGDYAEANFNVTTGPIITLNLVKGVPGTFVKVTGSGFVASDSSCTISGTPVTTAACTMTPGTGLIGAGQASFVVANVVPGLYLVTVTGTAGGTSDQAQAVFNVTRPFNPVLAISPPDGPKGTIVMLTGTGFLPSASACQLSSTGAPNGDPFLITSPSCSISSGSLTAQFTVGTSAHIGAQPVNVTADTGDKASINFTVDSFPTIRVFKGASIVTGGYAGQFFTVNVTSGQFSSGDQGSCTLGSSPGGLFSSSNCIVQSSGKSLTGTNFIVAGTASGFYTITVTGSQGDSAFTSFTVNFNATLVLSTTNATNGATVNFRGTGFSISDTGACTVLAYIEAPGPKHTLSNLLITSPSCTISSQVATGSFVVGPSATTNVYWNVTVRGSPQNDNPAYAPFNVTASITVSPTSGTINTVVSFSGSGFGSMATSCKATISPAMGSLGTNLPICGVNTPIGQVSGSFTVPTNAAQGLYVIRVTDNTLGFNFTASGTFTVGTPTAQITIVPNSILPGGSVAISGSGFNGNDTVCKVLSGTPPLVTVPVTPTCSISGGFVSSAFTVSTSATPGMYLITVSGYNGAQQLDFASNFLFVGGVTTVSTSTTSTTTTSTTPTSTTTTTTSTVVSTSLTTTTYSTTGILTQTFSHTTITTVSGITTTTITGLSTIFQTSTSMRTATITITTTGPILGAQQHVEVAGPGTISDSLGLLALLMVLIPMLLRRLLT